MHKKTKQGVTYLLVNVRLDGSKEQLHVFKAGRRILVGEGGEDYMWHLGLPRLVFYSLRYGWREAINNANVVGGPKLFAKLLRKGGDTINVDSGYAHVPSLSIERGIQYVYFTAPCGQRGRMTVAEADKLADAIETL